MKQGLWILAADLVRAGKRLEILRVFMPGSHRLATMGDMTNLVTASETSQVQEAARTLGIEVVDRKSAELRTSRPQLMPCKGRADALYVQSDPLMNTNRMRISILALGARLPNAFRNSRLHRIGWSYVIWTKLPRSFPDAPGTMSTRF